MKTVKDYIYTNRITGEIIIILAADILIADKEYNRQTGLNVAKCGDIGCEPINQKNGIHQTKNADEPNGKVYCPTCKKKVTVIDKMSGWICCFCRRILLLKKW